MTGPTPEQRAKWRRCCLCKRRKPLTDFTKNKSLPLGVTSECRPCHSRRLISYRRSEHGARKQRSYVRVYRLRHRDAVLRRYRRYQRANSTSRHVRERRNRERLKFRAREILRDSVKRGLVKKPHRCQQCGRARKPLHGHHQNYDKPLAVDWLCAPCHGQRHATYLESAL